MNMLLKWLILLLTKYDVNILFNYAPHQKKEAQKIYEMCQNKSNIILDIYAKSIRDFIKLMNQC